MMSRKMANGSSRNKNKSFDSLIGEDASEVDPSYKIFLEHLCEEGKSYAFHVPDGDHGMLASVTYEEDDINVMEMNTSIDESYAIFLSHMKIEGGFMVVEPEPGVTFVYEQEDEAPAGCDEMRTVSSKKNRKHLKSALENMVEDNAMLRDENRLGQTDNIVSEPGMNGPAPDNFYSQDLICIDEQGLLPYTESSDFDVCENDQGSPIAFSCGVPSTFDEKLDSVLSQPYDQNEYEELLRKATDRQPISRQRHLRNASKRYATEVLGLSYLDHYSDLAVQIKSADTDEGRLNLLRKFFFWLENLTHEGAYMPWIARAQACDPIIADDYE